MLPVVTQGDEAPTLAAPQVLASIDQVVPVGVLPRPPLTRRGIGGGVAVMRPNGVVPSPRPSTSVGALSLGWEARDAIRRKLVDGHNAPRARRAASINRIPVRVGLARPRQPRNIDRTGLLVKPSPHYFTRSPNVGTVMANSGAWQGQPGDFGRASLLIKPPSHSFAVGPSVGTVMANRGARPLPRGLGVVRAVGGWREWSKTNGMTGMRLFTNSTAITSTSLPKIPFTASSTR